MFKCGNEKISSEARLAMQYDKDLSIHSYFFQIESAFSHKVVKGFYPAYSRFTIQNHVTMRRVIPWAVRNELDSTPQICVQFITFA